MLRKTRSRGDGRLRASIASSCMDPFSFANKPPPGETNKEKELRLAREAEAERISHRIDRALEAEAKEKKKRDRDLSKLDVLLLGPAEAGKSTFLRQLRLQYDAAGLDAEREALRLVILLSLVSSVSVLLDLLDSQDANDDTPLKRGSSPSSLDPRTPRELAARHRLRLAPLLALAKPLREALDVSATGVWAESIAGHVASPPSAKEDVNYLDPTNSPVLGDVINTSNNRARARPAQSSTLNLDPVLPPGRLAQLVSTVGFGSSKDSRRARHHSGSSATSPNWTADGTFQANKDDPIHLVGALKGEISNVWNEAKDRRLIVGEEGEGAYLRGAAIELSESSKYFLDHLHRIAVPTWLPTDADLLNVRIRTRGVETHELHISNHQVYRICDVAGVRGVRHAWAPFFEQSSAIIFICAISEYNVCDPNDPTRNRLRDALILFKDICENRLLRTADMITFMNKVDILRRKIKSGSYPLGKYFPAYKGSNRTVEVLSFVQTLFEEAHRSRKRPFFIFATQANDARSIQTVTAAVSDILVRSNLASTGFI